MKTFNEKELSAMSTKDLVNYTLGLQDRIKSSTSTSSAIEEIITSSEDKLTASQVKERLESEYGITLKHDNMIYNVCRNKDLELNSKDRSNTKKARIIELLIEGKLTNKEIAHEVGTHYNNVIQTNSKNRELIESSKKKSTKKAKATK
jgi:hypothetical protein